MKKSGEIRPDPTQIGNIATPPFVRLPDPQTLFAARSARFAALAEGHDLAPYLRLLGDIAALQHRLSLDLPAPAAPDADTLARSAGHAMPPLDRSLFAEDLALDDVVDRFCREAHALDLPEDARSALVRLQALPVALRRDMAGNVLADAMPMEALAEHVFVAAAVQVHFAGLASVLDAAALKPVAAGVCPVCGGAPSASLIVGWLGAEGSRFCACSTCSTLWNEVRAKCLACDSTKEIAFQEVEGAGWPIKAETCGACRSYVKVLYQDKDARLDPVADDVASLGLDLLVKELGFRRGAVNPYLAGY